MIAVYKATNHYGESAHFGVESTARAWAKSGTVERIELRNPTSLSIVKPCDDSERGHDIDSQFAPRLALLLECMLIDSHGNWGAAAALLDEYKAAWEAINPSPPTFMGEPMPPDRRERLRQMRAERESKEPTQ